MVIVPWRFVFEMAYLFSFKYFLLIAFQTPVCTMFFVQIDALLIKVVEKLIPILSVTTRSTVNISRGPMGKAEKVMNQQQL